MTLPHLIIETTFALVLLISVVVIVRAAMHGARIINPLSFPEASPPAHPLAGSTPTPLISERDGVNPEDVA